MAIPASQNPNKKAGKVALSGLKFLLLGIYSTATQNCADLLLDAKRAELYSPALKTT